MQKLRKFLLKDQLHEPVREGGLAYFVIIVELLLTLRPFHYLLRIKYARLNLALPKRHMIRKLNK